MLRNITFILAFILTLSVNAQSKLPYVESQPAALFENGYMDLPEPIRIKQDAENNIIRYFFDFSCIYCKSIQDVMSVWSSSLPDDYTFVYHHIGIQDNQEYYLKASALTYVMNLDIENSRKQAFLDMVFTHVNKINSPEQMMRLIKEVATSKRVKIELKPLLEYLVSEESITEYSDLISLQRKVSLQVTPSILIGGRFFTHLGLTDGHPEYWTELINKVTSVHYYWNKGQIRDK